MYHVTEKFRATFRMEGLNFVWGKWEVIDTDTKKNFNSLSSNFNLSLAYLGFEMLF